MNSHVHEGIEHFEGDMFESVPKGDAILLKVSLDIIISPRDFVYLIVIKLKLKCLNFLIYTRFLF